MRYALGRSLEILGLVIVPLGLATGIAFWGTTNAIKYEIACLAIGAGVFYVGHWLRTRR